MATHTNTKTASTFLDLLNLVECRLKELLPQIKGALDQIKEDFKVAESDSYIRMYRSFEDLDDLIGHLEYLRNARNAEDEIIISIPSELAGQAEAAADDVQYALNSAASVLQGLHSSIVSGFMKGDDEFALALMHLSSRALVDIAEKEGVAIARVGSLIYQEESARANVKMAKAA